MQPPMIYGNQRDAEDAALENGAAPEEIEMEEEGDAATPEEQEQYDQIVENAKVMIFSTPGATKSIAERLRSESQGNKTIDVAIGQQAGTIMLSIKRSLKESGAQTDSDEFAEVFLNAGTEVVSDITEIAAAVGLVSNEEFEQVFEKAGYEAVRFFGEQELQSGELSPELQAKARAAVEAETGQKLPPPRGQPPQQTPQQGQQQPQGILSGAMNG